MYRKAFPFICLLLITSNSFGVITIPKFEEITTEVELRHRSTYFGDFGLFEKHRENTDSTTWEHEFRGDLLLKKDRHLLEFRLGHTIQEEADLLFPPDENTEQVRQAYLDFNISAYDELFVRLGRQELSYNQGILIDPNDWFMEGFYFDAVKVYWDGSTWDIDMLYAQMADEHDNTLAGINFERTSERHTINEFYLWYFGIEEGQDRIPLTGAQGVDAFNLGTRMEGKLTQDVFYHWMVNYQFGDFHTGGTTSDLDSFNFLVNLDYFVDHKIIRNVGIEFTVSSGNDADSAEVETFIPAYGNKHNRSGGMDWMSMMNSEILTLYVFADLHPKIHGLVEYHHFAMNSLDAGWYLADLGAAWFDDSPLEKWPRPGAEAQGISKEVGQEIDFHLIVGNNPDRKLSFGYSIFFPGGLLENWDWLSDDTVNWGYVQTELKF